MEKRRAVTFFIKTLADDQRRGSYCWKTPSSFPVHTGKRSWIHTVKHTHTLTHTHTQSSTFLHPPPHSCFQTSAESYCHIFFPKSQLKKLNVCMYECVCECVCWRVRWLLWKHFDWQTLSGGPEGLRSHSKRFIGKMHPRMHLGGSCPGAIIE